MYRLWVKIDGQWRQYASFQGRYGDYAEQVQAAIVQKRQDSRTEEQNAASVMEAFVLGKNAYGVASGKLVMRALRRFDEVGLSNEVCESLEEALNEGADEFALLKDGEEISSYALAALSVRI